MGETMMFQKTDVPRRLTFTAMMLACTGVMEYACIHGHNPLAAFEAGALGLLAIMVVWTYP